MPTKRNWISSWKQQKSTVIKNDPFKNYEKNRIKQSLREITKLQNELFFGTVPDLTHDLERVFRKFDIQIAYEMENCVIYLETKNKKQLRWKSLEFTL
jgi:hypothetical protein